MVLVLGFHRYIYSSDIYEFTLRECRHVMQISPAIMTIQLLNLLSGLLSVYDEAGETLSLEELDIIMAYAVAWSCGGLFEPEDRVKIDDFLRKTANSSHPSGSGLTIFDYFVDSKTKTFQKWTAPEWIPPKAAFSFSSILIPTTDSER